MSDSDDTDNTGKISLIVGVGFTALVMAFAFAWSHYRGPDGAHDAWLAGDATVLVEEFRSGEDGDDERFVLQDLKTGKRLADRSPGDLDAMFVVGDKLWLHGRRDYGLEAWSVKDLTTVVTAKQFQGMKPADSTVCTDGRLARLALTDGRFAVIDLQDGKVLAERDVQCSGRASRSSPTGSSPLVRTERDGASQRYVLKAGEHPFAGGATFLEPGFAIADDGRVVEHEGELFVIHRVQLGEDHRLQLSRVGSAAVKWTMPLGKSTSLQRVLFAPPATLVVVGHDGVTTLDVATGKVLWRTGS